MAFSLFRDFDVPRRDGSDLNLKGDGYAVEFDTFCGGSDPPNPHIAIVEDDPNKHRVIHELARGFEIDVWHPVRIVFDRGTISVSFDGQEVIAGHEIAGFERFTGQFGFTAATGLGYERHLCRNIRWRVIER